MQIVGDAQAFLLLALDHSLQRGELLFLLELLDALRLDVGILLGQPAVSGHAMPKPEEDPGRQK